MMGLTVTPGKITPFFEEGGEQFAKYDEIRISVKDNTVTTTFYWKQESVFSTTVDRVHFNRGDVLHLVRLEGRSKVDFK